MGVFEDVIDKLDASRKRDPSAPRHEAEVGHGDVRVRVEAEDFDRIGIRIRELSVEGAAPQGELGRVLERQADALANLDTPPLTHLRPQEIDGRLGAGVLRTEPEEIHKGYFYEAKLDGGRKVSVQRHRRDPETRERSVVPFTADDQGFEEIVDALGGVFDLPSEG